jgi:hypothetical protein
MSADTDFQRHGKKSGVMLDMLGFNTSRLRWLLRYALALLQSIQNDVAMTNPASEAWGGGGSQAFRNYSKSEQR